ncbi:MAG: DNA repair protein RecO [Verrucomicrobiaceae bacterium]|nr:MAG: DNA repair protein RecO [Verrucomicrobiaceae bacterium]
MPSSRAACQTGCRFASTISWPPRGRPESACGNTARIRSLEEVGGLKPVDSTRDGRIPVLLEAVRILAKAVGSEISIRGNCDQGPFSLACLLRGSEDFLMDLAEEPENPDITRLLEVCHQSHLAVHRAVAAAGAHFTSLGDSFSGPDVISPAMFEQFSRPFEERLVREVAAEGLFTVIHICGDTTRIQESLGAYDFCGFELDYKTNAALAKSTVGKNHVLFGNIDPSGLVARGTADQVRAASLKSGNPEAGSFSMPAAPSRPARRRRTSMRWSAPRTTSAFTSDRWLHAPRGNCIAKPREFSERAAVHPTQATIIRLTRLTDSSLIVHWFTEEHGLIKTVAKGARRPKSPFAGQLDLFFGGEIVFQRAKRGELHALREVSIRHWREGLRRNYSSTLFAAYCCQLLESAVEPEHPEPGLYDLLGRALDHVERNEPGARALRHYERELARLLGISHDQRQAHFSLRDALGSLPSTRGELLERLSKSDDLSSSAEGKQR